ncbi:uncharacterized protein LOC122816479 isoform X2 [Protopterus annectens]|uniref:uncharacterized protein LOC122816479 isoform X2 n=1 Tax=Protopterus annectens TaxID=7888 RepID=UPI001CFBB220|nr:uncharacterized protein LOC122816479 isoform X2 [Protopterus annectens]
MVLRTEKTTLALKRSFDVEDVDEIPSFSTTSPLNSPFSSDPSSNIPDKRSETYITPISGQPPYQSRVTFSSNTSPLQSPVMKPKISSSLSFNRGITKMARTNGNAGIGLNRVSSFQSRINPNGFLSSCPTSDSDSLHSSTSSLEYQATNRLAFLPISPEITMSQAASGIKISNISNPVLKKFSSHGNMLYSDNGQSLRLTENSTMNHISLPSLDLHIAEDNSKEVISFSNTTSQPSPTWNSASSVHYQEVIAPIQVPNSKILEKEASFFSPENICLSFLNSKSRQEQPSMKLNKFPLNLDSLETKVHDNSVLVDSAPKPFPRSQLKLNMSSGSEYATDAALATNRDPLQPASPVRAPPCNKFASSLTNENTDPPSVAQTPHLKLVAQPQLVQMTSPGYSSTVPVNASQNLKGNNKDSWTSFPREHTEAVVQTGASFSHLESPGHRFQSQNFTQSQTDIVYNEKLGTSENAYPHRQMEIHATNRQDNEYGPLLMRKSGSKKEPAKNIEGKTYSMAEKDPDSDVELTPNDETEGLSPELFGYVGIEAVLDQMRRKAMKTAFEFNIMVVGQSGLGKSTLVNTLFKSRVSRKSCIPNYEEKIFKTVELQTISHIIEEKGVKLKLTVIDTPGFGDQINNENCWDPIVKYIQEQYEKYLREEAVINRKRRIPDSRVHCCIYFVPPTGHWLRPLDIEFMKRLYKIVNIVPVIAKADTLTLEERKDFKNRIRQGLKANGISVYPQKEFDEDAEDRMLNDKIRENIPFAVVGTDKEHQVNGKRILGRKTKWGIIEVENIAHCEFSYLRDLLIRSHLQDLKDVTHFVHYETYRVNRLNENNSMSLNLRHLTSLNGAMGKEEPESNL